jgi:hypothetical protein
MKTNLISRRFLYEATNQRSSRFLREATGCLEPAAPVIDRAHQEVIRLFKGGSAPNA